MSARRRMGVRSRIGTLLEAPRPWRRRDEQAQRLEQLEVRTEHLEALVEGLQDAVHRDSIRLEARVSQLARKTEPETLARTLSDDARRRGL